MRIGERIKERRIYLGLTVDDLAEKLNKNRATIYRYEKGDIENLPLDVLEPLAKALETTPAYLIGWDIEEKNHIYTKATYNPVYKKIHQLQLTDDEFDELYNYAQYIKSKRGC